MIACLGISAQACHSVHGGTGGSCGPHSVGYRLLLMAYCWFCCCVHQYASCAPAQEDI